MSANGRRWQRLIILFHDIEPFIDYPAKLGVNRRFIITMTTRSNDSRTLPYITCILFRPLDELQITSAFFHCSDSAILVLTITFLIGFCVAARLPENILALRAKLQTGCSLRGHRFFRSFYFSET
uniref:Uncharacterized protein n=1 Tax=Candidatus Kentrum sp. LPFa TaxID=2126335 RepID=A0A450WGV8_9GAMM|nr:MAG: hypothetical protein BECKLPF1236B_GA0070989_109213 [Candidatus Kentron sp. LPFa]